MGTWGRPNVSATNGAVGKKADIYVAKAIEGSAENTRWNVGRFISSGVYYSGPYLTGRVPYV